jgi:hypothetical protein
MLSPPSDNGSKVFIYYLLNCVRTTSEEGFNYIVADLQSGIDMLRSVKSLVPNLLLSLGMEFRRKIRSVLEKTKSLVPNMARN